MGQMQRGDISYFLYALPVCRVGGLHCSAQTDSWGGGAVGRGRRRAHVWDHVPYLALQRRSPMWYQFNVYIYYHF